MVVGKYLNPKNDVAFKRIFGTEKNKDILMALINSVLKKQIHRPVKEVSFLPRVQDPDILAKKTSVVDLMCRDEGGCLYIIEMQVATSQGFRARAQYYASKAYISQAKKGGRYSELEKVIFLAFTDYDIFPGKRNHKSDHQILDVVTQEQDFDKLAFTIVDLQKFAKENKTAPHALTLEEKFYYFLSHAHDIKPETLAALSEPILEKAFRELDRLYWSESQLLLYEQEEKREWDHRSELDGAEKKGEKKGREEGLKLGEKKGREEERAAVIEKMRQAGLAEEEIKRILK